MRRLLVSLLLLLGAGPAWALNGPVRIDSGLLQSGPDVGDGVQVFRGIPYAAPPVGELRWREPQPVQPWQGLRDGSIFGPVCVQPSPREYQNLAVLPGSPAMSEDCLYLNVWTGADSAGERRPVMVWIYGGAFEQGAGSIPLYDGQELAARGAVVVTLNYRLGPYGFFAHPALSAESQQRASGNYGLMDIQQALRWVQKNIAAFGGNPDNVTVFGQSAGAMAISALLTSPQSEGLLHKVIAQSGAWMGLGPSRMRTLENAERQGEVQAGALQIDSVEQLRALNSEQVSENLRGAGMIVDGRVLPEDPSYAYDAGRQLAVDVLVGSNADEGSFLDSAPSASQWREQLNARWDEAADTMLGYYPADAGLAANSFQRAFSDAASWHMRLFAAYQARVGKRAWVYYFSHNPPVDPGRAVRGASHSAELPYVFSTLGQARLYPDTSSPSLARQSAPDRQLAGRMTDYWFNFAFLGNPNGAGLPSWPLYRNMNSPVMILAPQPRPERQVDARLWHQYNLLYQKIMKPAGETE